MASNYICLLLSRKLKYWFPQMIHPRLSEENSTNLYVSLSNGILGHWYVQVLCIKSSFFGTVYGMAKAPFVWFDASGLPLGPYITSCSLINKQSGTSCTIDNFKREKSAFWSLTFFWGHWHFELNQVHYFTFLYSN